MDNGFREFTPRDREYIRTKIMPCQRKKQGDRWVDGDPATEAELEEFLLVAQSYGLDPIRKQIFATRRKGQLISAPTIDGLRYLAARTRELDGQDEPRYGPTDATGIPEWCAVTVYRKGCRHGFTAIVYWAEYARGNPTDTQREMPRLMLFKATESQALRKAFPEALGGLVSLEEMGASEDGEEPKEAPWQHAETPTGARKPDPPKATAADVLAAARAVADRSRRGQEFRARTDAEVKAGVQRQQADAAQIAAPPDAEPAQPAAGRSEGHRPAAGPAPEEPPPYRPGEDAQWFLKPGIEAGHLGPAAEAVVLQRHAWNKGAMTVDVAGKATGQKASITFNGPAAATLATVRKDGSIWVRFAGSEIGAYHVPGGKTPGRKAG